MSRATNPRQPVDRLPAQRLVRAGDQRRGGPPAAGPARRGRADRAVPHRRRRRGRAGGSRRPQALSAQPGTGGRRHDRVGLFRFRVRRPRAVRARAHPGRDSRRRTGARLPRARRRCLRLVLAGRSGPVRTSASTVGRLAQRPGLDDGRRRLGDRGPCRPTARELRRHHPRGRGRPVHRSPGAERLAAAAAEVEVTETTVSFSRDYPPAPIAGWHAELLGLPTDAEHAQRESGAFVSPGLWVDRWEVHASEAVGQAMATSRSRSSSATP